MIGSIYTFFKLVVRISFLTLHSLDKIEQLNEYRSILFGGTNKMQVQHIFKCPITNYYIEYLVDEKNNFALMANIVSDYQHMKPLLMLLRTSIDQLKEKNILKIRQIVLLEEWNEYLEGRTTWSILEKQQFQIATVEIECEIDDFLKNYGAALGL